MPAGELSNWPIGNGYPISWQPHCLSVFWLSDHDLHGTHWRHWSCEQCLVSQSCTNSGSNNACTLGRAPASQLQLVLDAMGPSSMHNWVGIQLRPPQGKSKSTASTDGNFKSACLCGRDDIRTRKSNASGKCCAAQEGGLPWPPGHEPAISIALN